MTIWSVIDTSVLYRASGASWPDIAYVGLTRTPEIQQPDTIIWFEHVPGTGPCLYGLPRAQAPGAQPGVSLGAGNVPRVRRQLPLGRGLAGPGVRPPATAKRPKNSPSLPRSRRGWRHPTGVYASVRAPDSILVYDLSGNRQTSEECTVATTSRWVGGTATRVYVAMHRCDGQHPGVRPVRQPPNLRRIYRRYHARPNWGWRLPQPACTSPMASPTDAASWLRPDRQPPNVRRIHRRYHVAGRRHHLQPACTSPATRTAW